MKLMKFNPTSSRLLARLPAGLAWATLAVAAAGLVALPVAAQPTSPDQRGGAHAEGRHGGPGAERHARGPHGGHHSGHGGGRHGGDMHGGFPGYSQRMLDDVKATPEQRSQLKQIMEATRKDMQAQRAAGASLRDETARLLAQPTVDAAALEALRQKKMAHHDQASKRMNQALLDASRVLTPQQRQQLAERMQQRRQMGERHRQERQNLERPQDRPQDKRGA